MGTYTTNYNLFMPTIGEQGWGTLVNENFSTIDSTMSNLNTRLTAVESEVNGNLSCTSVTTSGKVTANGGVGTTSLTTSSTITSTGVINANGGVKGGTISGTTGTFSGVVTATKFTPTSTTTINVTSGTPTTNGTYYDADEHCLIFILPDVPKTQYTGSVKVTNTEEYGGQVYYNTKWGNNLTQMNVSANATVTISFTNVPHVYIYTGGRGVKLGNITFS